MDSFTAGLMGMVNRGRPLMVFDWNKAAQRIQECGARHAAVGLRGDWGDDLAKIYWPDSAREIVGAV